MSGYYRCFFLLALSLLPKIMAQAADPPSAKFVYHPCAYIQLPDGRRLAYAEAGDPDGKNILIHHHGISSCRLDVEGFFPALKAMSGVRLFVLDRPGIGQSDPFCGKSFLSWPADVKAFADTMKIDRFGVIGGSGGTPYALAVARALPDRVTAVSIACPMAPLECVGTKAGSGAQGADFALRHPRLTSFGMNRFAIAERRRPDRFPPLWNFAAPADRQLLSDPTERCFLSRITDEAFRQGPCWQAHEAALLGQPWSCWLPEVRAKITIYSGCSDTITPPVMANSLGRTLPNAQVYLIPGEGHLSIGRRFATEILSAALPSKSR
jgi:pimeloyl-ACP methyl ester carboxylesterase